MAHFDQIITFPIDRPTRVRHGSAEINTRERRNGTRPRCPELRASDEWRQFIQIRRRHRPPTEPSRVQSIFLTTTTTTLKCSKQGLTPPPRSVWVFCCLSLRGNFMLQWLHIKQSASGMSQSSANGNPFSPAPVCSWRRVVTLN